MDAFQTHLGDVWSDATTKSSATEQKRGPVGKKSISDVTKKSKNVKEKESRRVAHFKKTDVGHDRALIYSALSV